MPENHTQRLSIVVLWLDRKVKFLYWRIPAVALHRFWQQRHREQRLPKQFAAAVIQEVEKAVAPYEQQKNADRLLINALQSKVSVLSESNMELSSRNLRMENRHQADLMWRDRLLRIFAEMFYQSKELFRKAVDAIISLATPDRQGRHRDIFRNEEATAIKETMNEFADTESGRISIGKWLVDYASSKAELSDLDIHHAQGEVDGVAQGRYDWRISKGNKRHLKLPVLA